MPSSTPVLRALLTAAALCAGSDAAAAQPIVAGGKTACAGCVPAVCPLCRGTSQGRSCACGPNFWIISSRRCKQGGLFRERVPPCRLEQFQYVHGRAIRRRPEDFSAWLVPGAPVVVVIHGVFTRFDSLLTESRALCRWLHAASPGRPLNVVVYSWPSDRVPTGLLSVDVTLNGRFAAFNAFYLSRFLTRLPAGSRVCLFGHSLGARTVASLLHLQAGGAVQGFHLQPGDYTDHRYRAVLLAAAIDHHWLNPGERYGRGMCRAEALVNVHNANDLPLLFYPLRKPFGCRALGTTAFTRRDLQRLGPLAAKIAQVDASALVGRHHAWIYYFNRPEIARSVHQYIDFSDELTISYRDTWQKPPRPVLRHSGLFEDSNRGGSVFEDRGVRPISLQRR